MKAEGIAVRIADQSIDIKVGGSAPPASIARELEQLIAKAGGSARVLAS